MQNPARGPWNLVLSVRSFVWAAKEPLKEPCCCPSLPSDRAFTAGALGSVQPTSPEALLKEDWDLSAKARQDWS